MRRRARWLLLLTPALLAGCGVIPGWSSSASTPGSRASAGAGGAGGNWIVVAQGSATPSPTPSRGVSPSPSATGGFLPRGTPRQYPTPQASCTDTNFHNGRVDGLTVTPGTTSATATWINSGGPDLVAYRLTAISQSLVTGTQRDVGWVTVTPGAACTAMSATITGLDRKTPYTVSLDEVYTRRSGDGTRAATVARALIVWTT